MTNKILIFGSEGFIGSHLVEELLKQNYEVKAFVLYNFNSSIGWLENLDNNIKKNIEICFGDIRDYQTVKEAINNCKCIINLAALIGIPYSYHASYSYIETNISGTLNILNACKNSNINKAIFASTSEVYGSGQYFPMDERHPLSAQSPYAATKIASDQLAMSFYKSFNLPVSIIRPFNTFGPRQSERAVIPTIISQYFKSKKFLNIGSIDTVRDFTFVTDTANAFTLAINSKKAIGEVINLGTSYGISIKEIIKMISQLTNKELIIKKEKERVRPSKSEVNKLISSNEKAKKLLKWKPKYNLKSGFKKGLEETIQWFSKNENLQHYKSKNFVI